MILDAWCGHCGEGFRLAQVVEEGRGGRCPRCDFVYSHEYNAVVGTTCAQIITASVALDDALSRLVDIDYLEADASGAVIDAVDRKLVDLLVLDGEAWPAGGLGVSRELKNSRDVCPPIVVLVARADDKWLGKWSQADAVLTQPIDAVELATTVVRLRKGNLLVAASKESS